MIIVFRKIECYFQCSTLDMERRIADQIFLVRIYFVYVMYDI